MRDYLIYTAVLAGLVLLVFVFSGCSSLQIVNERAISLEDIVNLTKADLSADVIISHIDATNSIFKLTSDEIIWLKEQGVDDTVIQHILENDIDAARYEWMDSTSPYDYWGHYASSYYYPIYDYYFNRYSGYYYPYSYYYRPYSSYYYGGLSFYNNPYYVRRVPGMVGRFYEYAPSIPVYERDFDINRSLRFWDKDQSDDESDDNNNSRGSRNDMRLGPSGSNNSGSSGGISAPRRSRSSDGSSGSDSSGGRQTR